MDSEQTFFDRIEHYARGTCSDQEKQNIEAAMAADADFRKKAEEHILFLKTLQGYGRRRETRRMLDTLHEEVLRDNTATLAAPRIKPTLWRKYWPMAAVAASVAFVSIIGTLITARSMEERQKVNYQELRRDVESIRKSQHRILADIAESAKEEVDRYASRYTGTGFLISTDGYLATSYHVIKDADSVYIANDQFGPLKVKIVYSDPSVDISILRIVDTTQLNIRSLPYTINKTEADLGEEVFTLGYPRNDVVFGEGSVSASTGYLENPKAYQISVPANPGNSGGPLLDRKGNLVGIISGMQTETTGATFAIKSGALLEAIAGMPVDSANQAVVLPRRNYIRNAGRIQQIKRWRELVFMVKVYKN
jgi:S1-C subfamily serine protease